MKTLVPAAALALTLLSTAAVAETPEQRQACMNDAFRVCAAAIPDRHNVYECMVRNKHQLSAACRTAMAHPTATPAIRDANNASHRIGAGAMSRAEYRSE